MALGGSVSAARAKDIRAVLALLRDVGLPTEGVKEHFDCFLVWRPSGKRGLKGCVGLEVYEESAVLRSVAVDPEYQKQGVGTELVQAVEEHARNHRVKTLHLLTTTAEAFFAQRGYVRTDRDSVPQSVAQSIEFRSICPKSSVCMSRVLGS